MMYKILTMLIILLSKLRRKFGDRDLRFDRTVALPMTDSVMIECCDCGLKHFIAPYTGAVPVRPKKYDYKFRLGETAQVEKNHTLISDVLVKWHEYKGVDINRLKTRKFYRMDK